MNSINRKFGRLMSKGGAVDSAKVSVLLKDYEDADITLTKIIEASKAWRDAWVSILTVKLALITSFADLYEPIVGTSDGHRDNPVLTPRGQLERTAKLKEVSLRLKTDLMEEVIMMDSRVIGPATDAKEFLQPLRRTIKKRENKRLDWERTIDKVNNASKKMARTDKENAALAKAEDEQARASDAFKVADEHLREVLPAIINAAFSMLPHLLGVQILIQHTLLAQYYTIMHTYCEEVGYPSPPPPMDDVIATWQSDIKPAQQQIEGINCVTKGRAIHQSLANADDRGRKSSTLSVFSVGSRRGSSQNLRSAGGSVSPNPDGRLMRFPSPNPIPVSPPHPSPSPDPTSSYTPGYASSHLSPNSSYSANSSAGPKGDYFQHGVGKKKPPPPPPKPKRIGSDFGLYATALYAFDGQGEGDLSFQENDRIRVVKKTDSTDDWWEGELRGRKGSFPANYCKIG